MSNSGTATSGQTGAYRIRVRGLQSATLGSTAHPVPVRVWADRSGADPAENENLRFTAAGVLAAAADFDEYELDLTNMEGRYVTIDAVGMDDGSGAYSSGTTVAQFDPLIELLPATDACNDSGYVTAQYGRQPILRDDNGGLRTDYNKTRGAAQLGFTAMRGKRYRVVVKPALGTTTLGKPYHVMFNVRPRPPISWNGSVSTVPPL